MRHLIDLEAPGVLWRLTDRPPIPYLHGMNNRRRDPCRGHPLLLQAMSLAPSQTCPQMPRDHQPADRGGRAGTATGPRSGGAARFRHGTESVPNIPKPDGWDGSHDGRGNDPTHHGQDHRASAGTPRGGPAVGRLAESDLPVRNVHMCRGHRREDGQYDHVGAWPGSTIPSPTYRGNQH